MHSSNSQMKSFDLSVQPAQAWIAILGFVLFSALCIVLHASNILRLLFPASSFAVGLFLYLRHPGIYIGFTFWIWFLTPWVRRLVDYQNGWQDPSTVLLAPYLVTFITVITFLRYFPLVYRQTGLPFVLAVMGILYGFLVGLINLPIATVIVSLLNWLTPVLFGFHLFVNWQDYPDYRQIIERTFLWGALVIGAYGVWQYLVAPDWDRFWLVNMANQGLITFGQPEPLAIRVFSTMNANGPFAIVMMAALLLLFNTPGILRFPASAVGYLSFLLSLTRAAWLGWFTGVLIFVTSVKPRIQIRLIMTILIMVLCVLPLTTMEPFHQAINSRFQTFSNTSNDISYNERSERYEQSMNIAFSEVVGKGLGGAGNHLDSAILNTLFSLGWIGTSLYWGGLLLLILGTLHAVSFDPFVSAARAISIGVFIQLVFGSVMLEVSGVILWGFLGIAMAARQYYQHRAKSYF
ncbi:O-antigen ligase domain-containing protein [Gloeocapsopsis crepidinum LEGE 06123]|uniref:O-antigen ligase domain-containing protein n=2 Tax=Gloeocapsopsis crepidinum TaxID=693223 RepID=A0ABR9UTK8_9CHRO|nr:O-antigen ligase domain-containing protein [Gloeocapsopsis crepidinum LEGE 06123]